MQPSANKQNLQSAIDNLTPLFAVLTLQSEIPLHAFQQLEPTYPLIDSLCKENFDPKYAAVRNAHEKQRQVSLNDPLFVSYCEWLKRYSSAYLAINNNQSPDDFERFLDCFTLQFVRDLCDDEQVPAETKKALRSRLDGLLYRWSLTPDEQPTFVIEHFQYIQIYLRSLGKQLLVMN